MYARHHPSINFNIQSSRNILLTVLFYNKTFKYFFKSVLLARIFLTSGFPDTKVYPFLHANPRTPSDDICSKKNF